jgi:hypothetical protein
MPGGAHNWGKECDSHTTAAEMVRKDRPVANNNHIKVSNYPSRLFDFDFL